MIFGFFSPPLQLICVLVALLIEMIHIYVSRYRCLDLRRQQMNSNIMLRHRVVKLIRRYLEDIHGFVEVLSFAVLITVELLTSNIIFYRIHLKYYLFGFMFNFHTIF